MNYKLLIMIFLAVTCFINNLFVNFDVLQEMVEETEVATMLIDKGIEATPTKYPKMIFRYLIYYLYFYDFSCPLTIFELITIGG